MTESKIKIVTTVIVALCALFTLAIIGIEYRRPMIAIVQGGEWKAPGSVVTDLKAMDGKRKRATDPDRMTATDATGVSSLYRVCIYNKGKYAMQNPQMAVTEALHWQIAWTDENGAHTREYSSREMLTLPEIGCMRDMEVAVWVAREATRSNAGEILITQDGYGEARLVIRTPVSRFVQWLHQHTRKLFWISLIGVAVIWRRKLAAISALVWGRIRRTTPAQQQS